MWHPRATFHMPYILSKCRETIALLSTLASCKLLCETMARQRGGSLLPFVSRIRVERGEEEAWKEGDMVLRAATLRT